MNGDMAAGRAAAERLCREWPDISWIHDPPGEAWARAAIERLGELMRDQWALFRASREGSERGAETLSPRRFQGLLESLQNADDLCALELRIGVRQRGGRWELLVVHDGNRVQLSHVGAMVLPWVTTKADDPEASGRFGIGQKTLRSLGGPIQVHCVPFHFRMDANGPVPRDPEPPIEGIYSPERHETLILVPLRGDVDIEALVQFLEGLGSRVLLFLRSVRRISLVDLRTGKRTVDHRLVDGGSTQIVLPMLGTALTAERIELRDLHSGQRFTRYGVERPVSNGEGRYGKATGATTTLGVALSTPAASGGFYDRLPLPLVSTFGFSVNAQFDPDTPRSTLIQNDWNERRIADLGELVAAAALDCFGRERTAGWRWVPLKRELTEDVDEWLAGHLRSAVAVAQRRIADELRFDARGEQRGLSNFVYEEERLHDLLTPEDQERLRPDLFALVPDYRDSDGRWREVLRELERSQCITTSEALATFDQEDDQLGERDPSWYVKFAAAAIDADELERFLLKRSVLLADGRRIEPPASDDPRSLVCGNTIRRLRLRDEQLIDLRDAFERLAEDDQRTLGPRIGRNVELRGFTFDEKGTRFERWVSPAEAYLPAAIDRETDSFARAAATTPRLTWLDGSYSRVLKRAGGRKEIGAQRLLSRLGAATAPRLVRARNEAKFYQRDPRMVSSIIGIQRPDLQMGEIRALTPGRTHLLEDRWAPDLDAAIANICRDRKSRRRRGRALALLGTLARTWERQYAEHQHAKAVYAYDGYYHDPREVTASWLARAASEPWLPSATGAMQTPLALCLPTEANRIAYASSKNMFLVRIDEHVLRSPALSALGLRRGPSATSLVSRLRELSDGNADRWTT